MDGAVDGAVAGALYGAVAGALGVGDAPALVREGACGVGMGSFGRLRCSERRSGGALEEPDGSAAADCRANREGPA